MLKISFRKYSGIWKITKTLGKEIKRIVAIDLERFVEETYGNICMLPRMCSHCLFPACWQVACWQLATRLLSSTDLLQVVPTTCYRPAIQQFVNKLWLATLQELDKITALLQFVDKFAASLLRTHLVGKLWDFYVCKFYKHFFRTTPKKVSPNFRRLALQYGFNKHDPMDWAYLWDVYQRSPCDADRRFLRTSLASFHKPKFFQK